MGLTLRNALETIASYCPGGAFSAEQSEVIIRVASTQVLRRMADELAGDVRVHLCGPELAWDDTSLQIGALRVRVTAPMRKATRSEVMAESKVLALLAEMANA